MYAFFFNKLVDIFKNVHKKVKEGKKQNKIDDVRNNLVVFMFVQRKLFFRCCVNLMKDHAKKGAYAFCCILQIVGGGAAYPFKTTNKIGLINHVYCNLYYNNLAIV